MQLDIYAYTIWSSNADGNPYILSYTMNKTDNIITIKSNLGYSNDIVTLDISQIKTNVRYECILSPFDTEGYIMPNWDLKYNIYPAASVFFETHHFTRIIGSRTSIIFVKTNADELFIKSETEINSPDITFKYVQNRQDLSMDVLLKKYSKDIDSSIKFLEDYKWRQKYFNLLSQLPARQSISYLDAQNDLLLKLVSILVESASDDTKKKLSVAISDYSELLSKFNQYNILDTKTEEQILNTVKRKENVRAAQKSYYDSLKES